MCPFLFVIVLFIDCVSDWLCDEYLIVVFDIVECCICCINL